MKIVLTPEEIEQTFHSALCNAVGNGYVLGYGLELEYDKGEYEKAKNKFDNQCWEDILMVILKDGGSLTLRDTEADETSTITIKEVYERMSNVPINHMLDMVNQQDDAVTADVIIQTIFFNEVIFG